MTQDNKVNEKIIDGIRYIQATDQNSIIINGALYIDAGVFEGKDKKKLNPVIKAMAGLGEKNVKAIKGFGNILGKAAKNYEANQKKYKQ